MTMDGRGSSCCKANSTLVDFTEFLKVHRAWFLVGFPKGNVPRLEANISKVEFDAEAGQYRIYVKEPVEVL